MYRHKLNAIPVLLLAASLASGCSERGPEEEACELRFSSTEAAFLPATRGLVEGVALSDTESGARPLRITAYLHPQSGEEMTYLLNAEFTRDGDTWKHSPAVYWPVGGTMDMIAYSAGTPFSEYDIDWATPNCARKIRIAVGDDRTRDDILYGACWNEAGSSATALSMHHSQALLEFRMGLDGGSSADCSVTKITLKNIHLAGDLIIDNNAGDPEHRWEFRRYTAADCVLADTDSVFGVPLTSAPISTWILIPEQAMTSIVFDYVIDGTAKTTTYDLPGANWIAGRRYTYEVTLSD